MKEQREERQRVVNAAETDERRKDERRKEACEGYCYIEMVGWMDRREQFRRNGNCSCD